MYEDSNYILLGVLELVDYLFTSEEKYVLFQPWQPDGCEEFLWVWQYDGFNSERNENFLFKDPNGTLSHALKIKCFIFCWLLFTVNKIRG